MADILPPRRRERITNEGFSTDRLAAFFESITSAVNFLTLETIIVDDGDHTTSGGELLICLNVPSSPITITLNETPEDGERVEIKRTNGPVSFVSTLGVDGVTTPVPIISHLGAPNLVYTVAAGEYSII